MNYQRDGAMATAEEYKDQQANYHPNTREASPQPDEQYLDPAWDMGVGIVDRYDSTIDHDDFTQPGNLYRLFDDAHKDRLATRIAGVLGQARKPIQLLQICHFYRADEDYGRRVAEKLGINLDAVMGEMAGAGA
jgi:catalase